MAKTTAILGLDIGGHSVKAVRGVLRRGRLEVTHAEILRLPSGTADVSAVMEPWLANLKLPATPCVASAPGRLVMFQTLTLAPQDPRSFEQAVDVDISRYNELASESMLYDFAPMSASEDERGVLIAMARPAVLDQTISLLVSMGLEVVDAAPTPAAMFNVLRSCCTETVGRILMVNIGHATTDIAVGTAEGMVFARSFEIGGVSFTAAVSEASGRSERHAEDFKNTSCSLTEGDSSIRSALTRAADAWMGGLEACMTVYRSSFPAPGDRPTSVVFVGGGSLLKGLPEYAAKKLGMARVEPAAILPGSKAENAEQFAVAAGLAMTGLGLAATRLSLLPPAMRDALHMRSQRKYWIGAGIAAALILGISIIGGYRDLKREQKRLSGQQRTLQRCQELATRVGIVDSANRQIMDMAAPLDQLVKNGPFMRDLMKLLADVKSPMDWITTICDSGFYMSRPDLLGFVDQQKKEIAKQKKNPPRRGARPQPELMKPAEVFNSIIVEGYTRQIDLSTVQRLISDLRAAPFVKHADLISDDRIVPEEDDTPWHNLRNLRFVIEIIPAPVTDQMKSRPPAVVMKSDTAVTSGIPGRAAARPVQKAASFRNPSVTSTHRGEIGEIEPSALIDKDRRTRWSSDYTEPQEVVLELAEPMDLQMLKLHWEIASAKHYTIALSADGKEWSTVFTKSDGELGPRVDEAPIEGAPAKFVKLELLNRVNTNWGFSIYEIEGVGLVDEATNK